MTQEKQETREEEFARVRSFLASQAMRRTPEQLVEVLPEAHKQFLDATAAAVPDAALRKIPKEGEWSAADVPAHVCAIAAFDERSFCGVIERGEQPKDVEDALVLAPFNATREQLLADIERHRERLIAVVVVIIARAIERKRGVMTGRRLWLIWQQRPADYGSARAFCRLARVALP